MKYGMLRQDTSVYTRCGQDIWNRKSKAGTLWTTVSCGLS
jgi:hypothetical protein